MSNMHRSNHGGTTLIRRDQTRSHEKYVSSHFRETESRRPSPEDGGPSVRNAGDSVEGGTARRPARDEVLAPISELLRVARPGGYEEPLLEHRLHHEVGDLVRRHAARGAIGQRLLDERRTVALLGDERGGPVAARPADGGVDQSRAHRRDLDRGTDRGEVVG